MKVKFLGTGTSTGVPEIGCNCKVCTSNDKKDRRLRASVLLNINEQRILIDCGPDFREQIFEEPYSRIDAVLLTHEHYDHVAGLDDLRPFCKFGDIDVYSNAITVNALSKRIPYCFAKIKYPGVPILDFHIVDENIPFLAAGIEIEAIKVMHHKLPISGYRVGRFAYLTDVKDIPEEEYAKLKGLDVLVMSALRYEEHLSHQTVNQALEKIKKIAPKQAYLIHMSHSIGLHEDAIKRLPEGVALAYDGLEITL